MISGCISKGRISQSYQEGFCSDFMHLGRAEGEALWPHKFATSEVESFDFLEQGTDSIKGVLYCWKLRLHVLRRRFQGGGEHDACTCSGWTEGRKPVGFTDV